MVLKYKEKIVNPRNLHTIILGLACPEAMAKEGSEDLPLFAFFSGLDNRNIKRAGGDQGRTTKDPNGWDLAEK